MKRNRGGGFIFVFYQGGSILYTKISLMTIDKDENKEQLFDTNNNVEKMTAARKVVCCDE